MTNKRKRRFAQDFSGESLTQQHFKDSSDVNNIIAHFRDTGIDPYAQRAQNQSFGYASSQTFSDAMQNIAEIKTAFADLPAAERQSHSNDPAVWLDSITTPDEGITEEEIVAPSNNEDVVTSEITPPEENSEAE